MAKSVTDQHVEDDAEATTRRGEIGRQTYERVRALLDGGMSRTTAFEQVGEETGRKPGTVATAFYRIAREQPDGGGVRQRPRKTRETAGSKRTSRQRAAAPETTPSVDRLVGDVHRSIDQLAGQLRELDAEVRQLREQATRYDQIRRLMSE